VPGVAVSYATVSHRVGLKVARGDRASLAAGHHDQWAPLNW